MNISFLKVEFSKHPVLKWLPAFLLMLAIFLFSARPSAGTPFSLLERILYKGGHVMGYAMLALAYWRAFNFGDRMKWTAWLLAVLYAVTDEFHQSFVPGRHPTAFDVLIYDNLGALTALWLASQWVKQKQPASQSLAVQKNS